MYVTWSPIEAFKTGGLYSRVPFGPTRTMWFAGPTAVPVALKFVSVACGSATASEANASANGIISILNIV